MPTRAVPWIPDMVVRLNDFGIGLRCNRTGCVPVHTVFVYPARAPGIESRRPGEYDSLFERSSNKMARNDDQGSMGSTLMVFLLGAAVGATCAILFAPMSGAETRQQIADKASDLKDKASGFKDQVA